MDEDEIYEDTWEDKVHEWLPYLKNDVLSNAFSYARYAKDMEELAGFGMENSLTLPCLANKVFSSLSDENYEPIYTFNDEFQRHFVRQSIKGHRCADLNQIYKTTFSHERFNFISDELDVNGNVCEILEKYFEYTKKTKKNNRRRT